MTATQDPPKLALKAIPSAFTILTGIMVVVLLLLATTATMSTAQVNTPHIVINEIDTNPPGSDVTHVSEWIELYNPTGDTVDIGGWEIASTTVLKKTMVVPEGTMIRPGQLVAYTHHNLWFTDINESVELRDASGVVIDKTPDIRDMEDDSKSWQRIYDGYDTDQRSDWKFALPTPGVSNGKALQDDKVEGLVVVVDTDQESYVFGQTVMISGSVSEEKFVVKPSFVTESVHLEIVGPDYARSVTLYPDSNLQYSSSIDLKKIHGIVGGVYEVTARYADASASTTFSVGDVRVYEEVQVEQPLVVSTARPGYVPGDYAKVTIVAAEMTRYATLSYTVSDPDGNTISHGDLAADINDGVFETSFLISPVNPVYGTYEVIARYAGMTGTATFEVAEDVPAYLDTDRAAYLLGDTVVVDGKMSGMMDGGTVDITILQTDHSAVGVTGGDDYVVRGTTNVMSDGSFGYEFVIPDAPERTGSYRITVSGDAGDLHAVMRVVAGGSDDAASSDSAPFIIRTDRQTYGQNDEVIISGVIGEIAESGSVSHVPGAGLVTIIISDGTGRSLESFATEDDIRRGFVDNEGAIKYTLAAVPDESGRFAVKTTTHAKVFTAGTYTATAKYRGEIASVDFSVAGQRVIDSTSIRTDRSVYGLNQTIVVTGDVANAGAQHAVITLTRPDGVVINSGADISGQRFLWTWETPKSDVVHTSRADELRSLEKSIFGVYRLDVSIGSDDHDTVFFKLSEDPDNDSFTDAPLFVTVSKPLYVPGDDLEVLGRVALDAHGSIGGSHVPQMVVITVSDKDPPYREIFSSRVYPNSGGEFKSVFELPITLFDTGTYRITATYGSSSVKTSFGVANHYVYGTGEPVSLLVASDREIYGPGETAVITGGPSRIISIGEYAVSVAKTTGDEIDCGTFVCGVHSGPITRISPDPDASFTHQFVIPKGEDAAGTYEVTVETNFAVETTTFMVRVPEGLVGDDDDDDGAGTEVADADATTSEASEPAAETTEPAAETAPTKEEGPFVPTIIIEKDGRLQGSEFVIMAQSKTTTTEDDDDVPVVISPVSVSGSMITAARNGDESGVNLQVTDAAGTCIIGQADGCLISGITTDQGRSYRTVTLDDGTVLRIVYSGPDVRLEKFAIYAGPGERYLPDMMWSMQVIKNDDQISSSYHKVTYQTVAG